MKSKKRGSIAFKVSILYILLAIINMAFFSILVYENQIDLITDNSKYLIKERTGMLISELEKFSNELKTNTIFKVETKEDVIKEIANLIGNKAGENKQNDFAIFTEEGKELYKSNPDIKITKEDVINGIKAVTSSDFSGKQYYSHIDDKTYEMAFYVPFKMYLLDDSILFLKFRISDFSKKLDELYKLIILIIIIIAVFHLLFAVFLFRFIIKPIQALHEKSLEISQGDLSVRADITHNDEIGSLGEAFNQMADSIQEKISSLQEHNERMETELAIAGDVQKIIFPKIEEHEKYKYSFFHKAFTKVSGDYYDIFNLGNSYTGFLIVDVSGHGVPAALITMIAKELFIRYAPKYSDPKELFKIVNTGILNFLGDAVDTSMYFTAFYLILDKNNNISFCNAGHTRPYLIRKNAKKIGILDSAGTFIGIAEEINDIFETQKRKVESGDKIVLFTDGISESRDTEGNQFGDEGIVAAIKKSFMKSGDEIVQAIIDDLSTHTDMDNLDDDATLIVVEIK